MITEQAGIHHPRSVPDYTDEELDAMFPEEEIFTPELEEMWDILDIRKRYQSVYSGDNDE